MDKYERLTDQGIMENAKIVHNSLGTLDSWDQLQVLIYVQTMIIAQQPASAVKVATKQSRETFERYLEHAIGIWNSRGK